MKTIILRRSPSDPVEQFPDTVLVPDSALVRPGLPLFLPDFAGQWTATLHPALRVSRLGKGISRRFAPRYYDAVTLILRLSPEPSRKFPGALAAAFDGCVQLGQWHGTAIDSTVDITVAGRSITLSPDSFAADEAIEAVSRYLTIRNGDIIAPLSLLLDLNVARGDIIEATLGSLPLIRARIK